MEENPEWLSLDYLKSVLKSSCEECTKTEDLTIVKSKATVFAEKGKNLTSTIYKVQVWYKQTNSEDDVQTVKYIVKKINADFGGWLDEKEMEIYRILPKLQEYVNCKYAPACFVVKDEPLVMEDLSGQGFRNNKVQPLDYAHCELAFAALAKFHAGSVLLHRQDPILVEETLGREAFTNGPNVDFIDFFETILRGLGEEIASWPECERFAEYMPIIANSLRDYFEDLPRRDGLRVLNHGDFQLYNTMYRYDSGTVREIRLIDFQICRFAPPTCDLQYFLGCSADLDVRLRRRDELFSVYLDTFNGALSDLGIDRSITKRELEDGLQKDYAMYFMSFCGLGMVLANSSQDSTAADDVSHDVDKERRDSIISLMKGKRFREFVSPLLHDLDERGAFQR